MYSLIANDFDDLAKTFGYQVLAPAILDEMSEPEEWATFFENDTLDDILRQIPRNTTSMTLVGDFIVRDRSFNRIVELTREWEKNSADIIGMIAAERSDTHWVPLGPPATYETPEGPLTVVPLNSAAELLEEGRRLRHCVATYSEKCLFDIVRIVSIRDATGRSLSTVQVAFDNQTKWQIVQHRGARNAEPPAVAHRVVSDWLYDVRARNYPVDLKAINAERFERSRQRRSSEGRMLILCGYDPRDEKARDTALAAWAFFLPKDERGLTYAEWVDKVGLRDRIRTALLDLGCRMKDPDFSAPFRAGIC